MGAPRSGAGSRKGKSSVISQQLPKAALAMGSEANRGVAVTGIIHMSSLLATVGW